MSVPSVPHISHISRPHISPRHERSVACGASPSPWFANRDVGIGCAARQNDCVGTDAFVRPASEASVRIIPSLRIIPIAVEERRFSAAMRQEKIRALAPARTRASECGMGRDFVSESSGVSVWRKIRGRRQSLTRPSQNARRLGHPLCGCVSGFEYPGHPPEKVHIFLA